MIIDSHAHYSHFKFNDRFRYLSVENGDYRINEGSRDDILAELTQVGISGVIEPAIDFASNQKIFEFCKAHPGFIFPAVGIHPTRTASVKWRDLFRLREYASEQTVIAIGETGLDYHYPRKEQHRLRQMLMFQYQIDLAVKRKLPLILHVRQAYKDVIRILKWNRKNLNGGVAHCFCGTKEDALELIQLGFCIGVGGVLLQTNEKAANLQAVVRTIPMEKILIETDSPYVLPDIVNLQLGSKAQRKIRNTSLLLPKVIQKIAELKEMNAAEVEKNVYKNTVTVFNLLG